MEHANYRYDRWTTTDEDFLLRTLLEHLEEGKTRIEAFGVIGMKLRRTKEAVGFRFYSEIYEQNREVIQTAYVNGRNKRIYDTDEVEMDTNQSIKHILNLIDENKRLKDEIEKADNHFMHGENKGLRNELLKITEEHRILKNKHDKIIKVLGVIGGDLHQEK